jgi:hypothetical protein
MPASSAAKPRKRTPQGTALPKRWRLEDHVGLGGAKGYGVNSQDDENMVGAIRLRQQAVIRDRDRYDELVILQQAENPLVRLRIRVVGHLLCVRRH